MFSSTRLATVATRRPMIDNLESRTLLHGGPGGEFLWLPTLPATPTPVVQADYDKASASRDKVKADLAVLDTDRKALSAAVDAAKVTLADQLKVLTDQLAADKAAGQVTLKADQAAIQAVYTLDLPAIQADLTAIKADLKARDTVKLAVDKAQLKLDQEKLATDLAAPLAQLKTDFKLVHQTIETDEKAIYTLIFSDAGVSAAKSQLDADTIVYKTDVATFIADRTKLLTDIKNNA